MLINDPATIAELRALYPAMKKRWSRNGGQTNESFYNCPAGLGFVTHTIGAPRQIQMSLQLTF